MTLIDTSLLPPGARIANGDNPRNATGVIEEGFVPEGGVLARQAQEVALKRGMQTAPSGANVTNDVLERVQAYQGINPMVMSNQTLQALTSGEITRDQAFTGNNTNFTGYYLEPAAKYVIPC